MPATAAPHRADALHQVWFAVFERFQLLDVCGPLQVFATANEELQLAGRTPHYETRVCALAAGPVRSSSGALLEAAALPRRLARALDTLVIPGGRGVGEPASR